MPAPPPTPAPAQTDRGPSDGVRVRGVTKVFDGQRVLGPVDLDAPAGAVTVATGPNGSGKTTLLRILATAVTPDEGDVHVAGFDPRGDGRAVRERVGVAMVNERSLWWRLSARRNLDLFAGIRGLPRRARAASTAKLLDEVGLTAHADKPVSELSAGQRQRVVLARALLGAPPVLLIDEPLRGLDHEAIDAVLTVLTARAAAGAAVVVAAPELDQLDAIAASVHRLPSQPLPAPESTS